MSHFVDFYKNHEDRHDLTSRRIAFISAARSIAEHGTMEELKELSKQYEIDMEVDEHERTRELAKVSG